MTDPEFKIIITGPDGVRREVPIGATYVPLIKDQLEMLKAYRDDGRKPSPHLLGDIKVYEYILEHPQAADMAELYMKLADKRRSAGDFKFHKMDVARELGWFN